MGRLDFTSCFLVSPFLSRWIRGSYVLFPLPICLPVTWLKLPIFLQVVSSLESLMDLFVLAAARKFVRTAFCPHTGFFSFKAQFFLLIFLVSFCSCAEGDFQLVLICASVRRWLQRAARTVFLYQVLSDSSYFSLRVLVHPVRIPLSDTG
jgi:hypothetical protein